MELKFMSARRILPIAAAFAVLMTGGCGQPQSLSADAQADETPDTRLAILYGRISGTPIQRSMGQYLGWRRAYDAISACMADAKFEYKETLVDVWRGHAPLITSEETWTAPLQWRVTSQNARGDEESRRLMALLMRPAKDTSIVASSEYQAQLNACQRGTDPTPVSPAGSLGLLSKLYTEAIIPAEETGPPVREYERCMSAAGFDLRAMEDGGYQGLLELLSSKVPEAVPTHDESTTDLWTEFEVYETAALNADAECRSEPHQEVMDHLNPLLSRFLEAHADELEALDDQWTKISNQAEHLGWPRPPKTS